MKIAAEMSIRISKMAMAGRLIVQIGMSVYNIPCIEANRDDSAFAATVFSLVEPL